MNEPRNHGYQSDSRAKDKPLTQIVIGAAILISAAAVIAIGAMFGNWFKDVREPDLPSGGVGSWQFISFEPGPPPEPMTGASYQYSSLQLRDDETFTISGTLIFPGNNSMHFGDSGDYEMRDSDTIRFNSRTEGERFWVFDLQVDGDELRLVDESIGVTHVFRRS